MVYDVYQPTLMMKTWRSCGLSWSFNFSRFYLLYYRICKEMLVDHKTKENVRRSVKCSDLAWHKYTFEAVNTERNGNVNVTVITSTNHYQEKYNHSNNNNIIVIVIIIIVIIKIIIINNIIVIINISINSIVQLNDEFRLTLTATVVL